MIVNPPKPAQPPVLVSPAYPVLPKLAHTARLTFKAV